MEEEVLWIFDQKKHIEDFDFNNVIFTNHHSLQQIF